MVARQLGVVCLVGCTTLTIDATAHTVRIGSHELREGEPITIDGSDGSDGSIYAGVLELIEERPIEFVDRVRTWRRLATSRRS